MTHFCNSGNQPRLHLTHSTATSLQFKAYEVTNLDPEHPAHVDRATYRIITPDRIELELTWTRASETAPEQYTLLRTTP
jgi:hypothetical protein